MARQQPAKTPDQYIGRRVEIARRDREMRQSDLVERLHDLGETQWRQTKISKIEKGQTQRISLADVIALAAALGVQPALLLSPDDGTEVQVTPKFRCSAADFRAWLRSDRPLWPEDDRVYKGGKLVPDNEWRRVRVTDEGRAVDATVPGETARATGVPKGGNTRGE
jgi:transcriptional regulator with XRE-family HTH domain